MFGILHDRNACDVRRRFLEHFEPFPGHRVLENREAGDIAARMRRLLTKPSLTGSVTNVNTMGIERVT